MYSMKHVKPSIVFCLVWPQPFFWCVLVFYLSATSAALFHWHREISGIINNKSKQMQRNIMMSSSGNIYRVTGPIMGEIRSPVDSPHKGSLTRSFDVLFDLCLNKRLNKQSRRRWIETPSRSLLRHCSEAQTVSPIIVLQMKHHLIRDIVCRVCILSCPLTLKLGWI